MADSANITGNVTGISSSGTVAPTIAVTASLSEGASVTGSVSTGGKGDQGDPATNLVTSVAGRQGDVTLTSADVGLGNVDNTSDSTKNAAAVTLTNKRITARVLAIASSATPTINTDSYDAVSITALATNVTSMTSGLSGTPNNFDKLIIRFKDNGTPRSITWGASFESKGVSLPTTTVASKALTVGLLYDSVTSKWGCVASVQES